MTNQMETKKQSKIISKVLSPALRLWLRSQVETVEELQVEIIGGDRQILGGYIPHVFLSSYRAVYQGLHLGSVILKGENIRINMGQILKGKSLRLLEPIQVTGEIRLEEEHFQASLSSPLLANGFKDLLVMLIQGQKNEGYNQIFDDYEFNWQKITFEQDRFALRGMLIRDRDAFGAINLQAGVELLTPQILRLHPLHLEIKLPAFENINLREFQVDLGSDVELDMLKVEPGQLCCGGRLIVRS